jgi:hypothetical protein
MKTTEKNQITKAVISASYNIEGTEAECEAAVMHQVEKERASGKPQNHLLKRNSDNPDFLKFTSVKLFYPTLAGSYVGVPLVAHPMQSALEAELDKVVAVGNQDVEWMQDAFSTFHRTKAFSTVNEGPLDKLSRANTAQKGRQGLGESNNALNVDISGDLALVLLRPLIDDPDNLKYDIILGINVMEIAKQFFPRNPHWIFQYEDGEFYTAKEPNVFLWDYDKLAENRFGIGLLDMIFNARKFYAKDSSMGDVLADLFTKEDGKLSPKRLANSLRILGPSGTYQVARFFARKKLKLPEDHRKLARVQSRRAQHLAEYGLGGKLSLKIKPCPQPACMIDTDSLEDVIFQQAMIDIDPSVSPYHEKLAALAEYVGGKWNCVYADNWIEIANQMFKKYGIPAEYTSDGHIKQSLFSEEQLMGEIKLLKDYQASLDKAA